MISKGSFLQRFKQIRAQTIQLTRSLEPEDFVAQPIVEVSPPKWHLGHSSWFFENFILKPYYPNYQAFDPDFAFIFNSYYESQGKRILRDKRGSLIRPTLQKVLDYRASVDQKVEELLSSEFELDADFHTFFEVGLQHEQQHQELLLTDIKYIFADNPLLPTYADFELPKGKAQSTEWLKIAEGLYEIGHGGEAFCFDNEQGVHQQFLHAAEISSKLVSNREYLEFIEDGGYQRFELWLSEGWEWVKAEQQKGGAAPAPLYWFQKEGNWFNFQLNGVHPLDPDLPLSHINYYEADAFARWKGMRLPTEFEWEVAARQYGNWGEEQDSGNFVDSGIFHPQYGETEADFFGACWEWTSSDYAPYPFYKQAEGALGEYNGKFMVNQKVLRGGSCATPRSHFRPTYRNFFHPQLQWQFSGLRLARYL